MKNNIITKKKPIKEGERMKVKDLIQQYNIQANIPEPILEHTIEIIMPPVDQYTYKQEEGKHIFTKTTDKVTDTITIDEKEQTASFLKEPEGLMPPYYKIDKNGDTIEMS